VLIDCIKRYLKCDTLVELSIIFPSSVHCQHWHYRQW